jgi:hypothetical protein
MPQAHTTLNLLPAERFPGRTSKAQFVTCIVTGFTGPSQNCAFAQNKCTTNRRLLHDNAVRNGYQTRADAVRIAVLAFLRTAEAGGFLGGF